MRRDEVVSIVLFGSLFSYLLLCEVTSIPHFVLPYQLFHLPFQLAALRDGI